MTDGTVGTIVEEKPKTSMLTDNDGNVSSTRIAKLSIAGLIMGIWAFTCVKSGILHPLDDSLLYLILGVLGIGTIQKAFELGIITKK